MDKKLKFYYDQVGDVLDISIGKPKPAISEEIAYNFFVRISPRNKKIVGFMVLDFNKGFMKNLQKEATIVSARVQR